MYNKSIITVSAIALMAIVGFAFTNPKPTAVPSAKGVWKTDVSHSYVQFAVTHMLVSEVNGNFKLFNGSVDSKTDDFSNADISFEVDVKSINTDNNDRDNHLKSDDFFNAEKFPKMVFKSTKMTSLGGGKYKLTGNLTIRDVTKVVNFDAKFGGYSNDPYGNQKAGFKATSTINRKDFGLKWNGMNAAGELVVSDEVEMKVSVSLNKQK